MVGLISSSCFLTGSYASPSLSTDGRFFNFSAQNDSYAQVMESFHQQTGLEYDLPPDLKNQHLPLVEIQGLTLKSALIKVLEGSNFDYILIAFPEDPEKIRKVLVTGRSVRSASPAGPASNTASAAMSHRVNRQMVEDPFGGGDMGQDEGAAGEQMMMSPVPDNPQGQGAAPAQPVAGPGGPQQVQPMQAQPVQPAPTIRQQQLGQPLPPMTPQQVIPGFGQQTQPQQNTAPNRRTPF